MRSKILIENDISEIQPNKAREPLVLDVRARSKKSRRKERGLTIYQPCSRKHGDFFSIGIDFLKTIPRNIAITRIYIMLIGSQGFIKHADNNIRARKFGMSRTSCDKMFSSDAGKDLFSIKDHRTGIVSCGGNSGYSVRCLFVNDMNISPGDFDKLVVRRENRSRLARALKKKSGVDINDPLYTTIPIDLSRIKILLASGDFKGLRRIAEEVLDLILYTSSISQCAVVDRDGGTVYDSSSVQSKKGSSADSCNGGAIDGSVKRLEVSASRDVIRRRSGISKNRQRRLELNNAKVITKRLDSRKVYTGTVEHCDAFIKEFRSNGHIGKCFMVATTRESLNGERFYNVYCQAPNFYTFHHLHPGQKLFYKIGSDGKRPVARKHTGYNPVFGYKERLTTYTSDEAFEEVCYIEELQNLRESEERAAYDDYSKGFRQECSRPEDIVENMFLNDSSIDFALINRFYRSDVLRVIDDRLKTLNTRKNIYTSNINKLLHVHASSDVPFDDFNKAFATFNGYVGDRKGRDHIFIFSDGSDVGHTIQGKAFRRAMDGVLSAGGNKDEISLLERVRRRLSILTRRAHAYDFVRVFSDEDRRKYNDLMREIFILLLSGFDKKSYAYIKSRYIEDLEEVTQAISVLSLFRDIVNGNEESRSKLSELMDKFELSEYNEFKIKKEEYRPFNGDVYGDSFLEAGNNFKIWDIRNGDSLSESTRDYVPFLLEDLRLLSYSIACKFLGFDSSAALVLRERISDDEVLPFDPTCFPKDEDGEVCRESLRGIVKWFSVVDFAWLIQPSECAPLFSCGDRDHERWRKADIIAGYLKEKNLWKKYRATNKRHLSIPAAS